MDNRELDEILQKYAESTRNDPNIALKKFKEKPTVAKQKNKKFKWQYALTSAVSAVLIVLCVVLPLTLTSDAPNEETPTYCDISDIVSYVEDSIDVLISKYGVDAFYPTYTEDMMISSVSLRNDPNYHGAKIGISIFEDKIILIELEIVPKQYILEPYAEFFDLTHNVQWDKFTIKYFSKYNSETEFYDLQIYFSDSKYDYFVTANSDSEVEATELLDILYS